MHPIILLLAGLVGIILAAHLVIKSALHIAERFKLSHVFVGLTILSVGTDLPELVIDITGAIYRRMGIETSGLIVGETIGTGMGQIALTLGIIGIMGGTLIIKRRILRRDGLMMLLSVVLLALVSIDGMISMFDGMVFLIVYLVYFLSLFREEKVYDKIRRRPEWRFGWTISSLIAGFIILAISSNLIISNAILVSKQFNVAQSLIGALVIGVGTSLPELVISIEALRKNKLGLTVGNLIGSNIFDVLVTLGIGATISGFAVGKSLLYFDIPFLLITSAVVLFFFRKDRKLVKLEAAALIVLFFAYVFLKIVGF